MSTHLLIENLLLVAGFLFLTAFLAGLAKYFKFPYTVMLLLVGLFAQLVGRAFHLEVAFELTTDMIYYFLLPLLLFESAFHINFHQFRLQIKTISFLATFGLLVSVLVVAVAATLLVGLPWPIALLFGAIISSNDPIAVLAIFKALGAPRRLALLAEGESMFNDATAVVVFRLIATFVVGVNSFQPIALVDGLMNFVVMFSGGLIVGGVMGYLLSLFIAKVENDRLVETTLTIGLALASFLIAEHFFHFSGVIATVIAGIMLGNVGRTRISAGVTHFMEELWEYIGFIAVSLIFFFATFTIDMNFLMGRLGQVELAILAVLIGRAVSIYLTFFITNHTRFFADEPNVPLSWQHILNWGGLRGVIPLVLVYSIPETFEYREILLQYTLCSFLFTLFVNATTIQSVLTWLKLNVPAADERIKKLQSQLFSIREAEQMLERNDQDVFDSSLAKRVLKTLQGREVELKNALVKAATPLEFARSLKLQVLEIERQVVQNLFRAKQIKESTVYEFEGELDLQQDAIEYANLAKTRATYLEGKIDSQLSFRKRLAKLRQYMASLPLIKPLLQQSKARLITERLSILHVRIVASTEALAYLHEVAETMKDHHYLVSIVQSLIDEQEQLRLKNEYQLQELAREYQKVYQAFEQELVRVFAFRHTA